MINEKHIYARFTGPQIFQEQGRILFALLRVFAHAGYRISLYDYLGDKPLDKYGQMIHSLEGLKLTNAPPDDPKASFLLYDRADASLTRLPWRKRLQVRFDIFSPFWFSNPVFMPYPMHPLQSSVSALDLAALRQSERKVRIFFAGDTQHYRRVWLHYPRTKLPRERIIDTVRERLKDDVVLIDDSEQLQSLYASPYTNKCVITASSEVRIGFDDWLPTLARAEFFLAPPGIVMPMCHNIIEAMAVGTIPITNYPEWLDPPLKHMLNCIAFETKEDLLANLKLVLSMQPPQIERMRSKVIDYYDRYLRPESFIARVENSPEQDLPVLLHSEGNVARNAKKLGRHSILIQGTTSPRPEGWLRRMLACYLG